jgi:mRNA interferase MazF
LGGHGDCAELPIENWRDAGLIKPSVVKPVIATIEHSLVIRKLGKLSIKDDSELKIFIKTILDL